uniref:Battenin n=1 Tax=Rhabditophanes sp. KR3021 TaxID=114890 RepID=A0AC35U4A6_9BILA
MNEVKSISDLEKETSLGVHELFNHKRVLKDELDTFTRNFVDNHRHLEFDAIIKLNHKILEATDVDIPLLFDKASIPSVCAELNAVAERIKALAQPQFTKQEFALFDPKTLKPSIISMIAEEKYIDILESERDSKTIGNKLCTQTLSTIVDETLLGICNNFGFVIMLCSAKDILEKDTIEDNFHGNTTLCPQKESDIKCSVISTGSVLLADILPTLIVKAIAPFLLIGIAYDLRHIVIVLSQLMSFLIVAFSTSINVGLVGVICASFGSGLGEITYLALASHFPSYAISAYSSGTGAAGLIGALAYAVMTDKSGFNLTPQITLISMTSVSFLFLYTFWKIIKIPSNQVNQTGFFGNIQPEYRELSEEEQMEEEVMVEEENLLFRDEVEVVRASDYAPLSMEAKKKTIRGLLPYMAPLVLVYFAEYLINQGFLELLTFTCARGFSLSETAQYRWYQVLYQTGVFISRSSSNFCQITYEYLFILPLIQFVNLLFIYEDLVHRFMPHISLIMLLILFEGLIGGKSYVSTFTEIHCRSPKEKREFSLSFVSMSDSIGIVLAGFVAIPLHNYICALRG